MLPNFTPNRPSSTMFGHRIHGERRLVFKKKKNAPKFAYLSRNISTLNLDACVFFTGVGIFLWAGMG
jgi:hypothetical protein